MSYKIKDIMSESGVSASYLSNLVFQQYFLTKLSISSLLHRIQLLRYMYSQHVTIYYMYACDPGGNLMSNWIPMWKKTFSKLDPLQVLAEVKMVPFSSSDWLKKCMILPEKYLFQDYCHKQYPLLDILQWISYPNPKFKVPKLLTHHFCSNKTHENTYKR
jgi:hypothetical protein